MLKALELQGFKSFADKTRFDFPPGITVVVGPNGSGKSNIVDAIKWVLGEQSAKSLRGKEMADVIFKGSGESGRRVLNSAEATIIFENSEKLLPIDAPEVHVTRRVYRSGEGEYLINGQPCRLKDIRDLFRGTGVGTDAYSLIEQGKVDRLLQASARDRRAIFEEAAGISRFKAKKLEAERRLARVEQNLLRLTDIVDEVENRLKSIRAQAGKARRYREYSQRLHELRTHVGRADWRRLSEQLDQLEEESGHERQQVDQLTQELAAHDDRERQIGARVESLQQEVSALQAAVGETHGRIVGCRSRSESESSRLQDLEEEFALHQAQLSAISGRAGDIQQRLSEVLASWEAAQTAYAEQSEVQAARQQALQQVEHQLEQVRTQHGQERQQQVALLDRSRRLESDMTRYESQAESAVQSITRWKAKQERAEASRLACRERLAEVEASEHGLLEQIQITGSELEAAQQELAENRRLIARRQEDLAVLRGRRESVRERIGMLEEMEARREGLASGVQQMLADTQAGEDPRWRDIVGIVADLLEADLEIAAAVDAALAGSSQWIAVENAAAARAIRDWPHRSGRIDLVVLAELPTRMRPDSPILQHPRVQGRLDRLLRFEPRFRRLFESLLGNTYLISGTLLDVEPLRRLDPEAVLVTSRGDVLRGAAQSLASAKPSPGLVSRRSELHALRQQGLHLEGRIGEAEAELERLRRNIHEHEVATRRLSDRNQEFRDQLADVRVTVRTAQQQAATAAADMAEITRELSDCEQQRVEALQQIDTARPAQQQIDAECDRLTESLAAAERQLQALEQQRVAASDAVRTAEVELAKREQRLQTLDTQRQQLETDRQERADAVRDAGQALQRCIQRRLEAERRLLRDTTENAEAHLLFERQQAGIRALEMERRAQQQEQEAVRRQLQGIRRRLKQHEDRLVALELDVSRSDQQRQALLVRFRDDYGIDIQTLMGSDGDDVESSDQRREIEDEIDELRQRINNIGAVNLEALNELDALEERYQLLSGQHQDLTSGKESLQRIIVRINSDSRRLFLETLEAIRSNFQTLYRRSFGGGTADIVLEEGIDVLEAGIEIVATPPGKPSFNNSLLSGGEKALTAVALLMAIFQFRPSPFCVLDEVDAPFDEANIGRFIDVMREFLGWTKFVIVTHSKKTMTAANTLYGVTMQESGVSKRVSVRFEDVHDDGHIAPEALAREDDSDRDVA